MAQYLLSGNAPTNIAICPYCFTAFTPKSRRDYYTTSMVVNLDFAIHASVTGDRR